MVPKPKGFPRFHPIVSLHLISHPLTNYISDMTRSTLSINQTMFVKMKKNSSQKITYVCNSSTVHIQISRTYATIVPCTSKYHVSTSIFLQFRFSHGCTTMRACAYMTTWLLQEEFESVRNFACIHFFSVMDLVLCMGEMSGLRFRRSPLHSWVSSTTVQGRCFYASWNVVLGISIICRLTVNSMETICKSFQTL